jgi:oligoendopeptidase F
MNDMAKNIESMSIEELKAELKRLKDNLCDLEDMHAFTFVKTSVHIGAEKAQNLTTEYEDECKLHNEQIEAVEKALRAKGGM